MKCLDKQNPGEQTAKDPRLRQRQICQQHR